MTRAISTRARTPKTRRPSSRRPPSATASSSRRSTSVARPCRASTFRPTGSTSSSSRRSPIYIEPLFTRDPAQITEIQVLMAMMAIKGIYAEYGVKRLNHGIGFDTAAIELLLPTYGESLGLEGQDLHALGAQSASGADPGDRGRLRRIGPLLRLRARHGALHRGAPGRVLHRRRRLDALQPRLLPGGRALRLRHVHRLDAADRSARQQLDRHQGPHRRLRRRAEHGRGRARPAPREPGLAQGRRARRARGAAHHAARPQAGRADGRDLPRAHGARVRRAARRLGSGGLDGAWRTRR